MVPLAGDLSGDIAGDEGKVRGDVGGFVGRRWRGKGKVVVLRGRFPIMVFNGLLIMNRMS